MKFWGYTQNQEVAPQHPHGCPWLRGAKAAEGIQVKQNRFIYKAFEKTLLKNHKNCCNNLETLSADSREGRQVKLFTKIPFSINFTTSRDPIGGLTSMEPFGQFTKDRALSNQLR